MPQPKSRPTGSRPIRVSPTAPTPIPSLIDEWLVEEPAVLLERYLTPHVAHGPAEDQAQAPWILLGGRRRVLLAWIIADVILRSGNTDGNPPPPSPQAVLEVTVDQPGV